MTARHGPFILLLLVAAASWWLLRLFDPDVSEEVDGSRHSPDLYVEDFTTTTMDGAGNPKFRLTADRMAHFPDSDSSEIEAPYLVMFRTSGTPWHLRSERALITANTKVILLMGRVHAWRNTDSGARKIEMQTRNLSILTDARRAETDELVVIRTAVTESRGVGMLAYLDEGRVVLRSRVTTRYEKNHG